MRDPTSSARASRARPTWRSTTRCSSLRPSACSIATWTARRGNSRRSREPPRARTARRRARLHRVAPAAAQALRSVELTSSPILRVGRLVRAGRRALDPHRRGGRHPPPDLRRPVPAIRRRRSPTHASSSPRPPRPHVISRTKPPSSARTSSASARSSRRDVYRGRVVTEKYAIAVGQRMRWREFQVVPSRESAIECLRVYYTLGETVIQLAAYLRSIGYACKIEHPIGDSDLLHIPIGLKAGFGELGRHGSIIHPKLGPLFRMGSVATSVRARRSTIRSTPASRKFCDSCRACRKFCPPQRDSGRPQPRGRQGSLGYDRYVVDTGRCFPYFAKHSYCSICLPVCAYNHKEWAKDFDGFETKLFPQVLMPEPPAPVDLPQEHPGTSTRGFIASEHVSLVAGRSSCPALPSRRPGCRAAGRRHLTGRVVDQQAPPYPAQRSRFNRCRHRRPGRPRAMRKDASRSRARAGALRLRGQTRWLQPLAHEPDTAGRSARGARRAPRARRPCAWT